MDACEYLHIGQNRLPSKGERMQKAALILTDQSIAKTSCSDLAFMSVVHACKCKCCLIKKMFILTLDRLDRFQKQYIPEF